MVVGQGVQGLQGLVGGGGRQVHGGQKGDLRFPAHSVAHTIEARPIRRDAGGRGQPGKDRALDAARRPGGSRHLRQYHDRTWRDVQHPALDLADARRLGAVGQQGPGEAVPQLGQGDIAGVRFPVNGDDHAVEAVRDGLGEDHDQGLAGRVVPVALGQGLAVGGSPGDVQIGCAADRRAGQESIGAQGGMVAADRHQAGREVDQALVGARPVQPSDRAILGVGVVVPPLGSAELRAHGQHRRPPRQQERREEGALVGEARGDNGGIVARPLHSVVPGEVVVGPVAVRLAVGLIVLGPEGDEVGQGEAVVGDDEVDAPRRPAAGEHALRSRQAPGELAERDRVSAPEAAHRIAKAVVPLPPGGRETAELVAVRPHVPGLGDQLKGAQVRILGNGRQERRGGIEAGGRAAHGGGEVEAEAGDAAQPSPGAQGVHGEAQARTSVELQGRARARLVPVGGGIVWREAIVSGVVESAEGQSGPQGVALASVVQHHIDDGLDAGGGEGGDRLAHFRPAAGRQPGIGREEGGRIVAPGVGQPQRRQVALVDPGRARHQLDGGDAEAFQVGDRRRMGEAGERPSQGLRYVGVGAGEAAHVQLVDHRLAPRDRGRRGLHLDRVDDDGLGHDRRAVALVEARPALGIVRAIGEHCRAQGERPVDGEGIWVDQQLVGAEALAPLRGERAVGAQAVVGAFAHTLHMAVEDRTCAAWEDDAGGLSLARRVEQAELDGVGVGRPHRDVDPRGRQADPQGLGRAVRQSPDRSVHGQAAARSAMRPRKRSA